ncbi:MAG TPA: hypothetical protein VGL93_27780 [Streptosporangiaceae bacterium]|jgi:uncharacterized membrane protein
MKNRSGRVAGVVIGVAVAVAIAASTAFTPYGVPVTMVVFLLLGVYAFGYLIWRLATGRDGLVHRGPTRRRQARLARRASPAAHAEHR